MEGIVISAFYACGKSSYSKLNPELAVDLEYDDYAFIKYGKNPLYPYNYLKAIKESLMKYKYVFVSARESVRTLLKNESIPYILVYPENTQECYKEWHDRFFKRGTIMLWDNVLREHFYEMIEGLKNDNKALKQYQLKNNEYISHIISKLKSDFN